jgi:hypothetical protein
MVAWPARCNQIYLCLLPFTADLVDTIQIRGSLRSGLCENLGNVKDR